MITLVGSSRKRPKTIWKSSETANIQQIQQIIPGFYAIRFQNKISPVCRSILGEVSRNAQWPAVRHRVCSALPTLWRAFFIQVYLQLTVYIQQACYSCGLTTLDLCNFGSRHLGRTSERPLSHPPVFGFGVWFEMPQHSQHSDYSRNAEKWCAVIGKHPARGHSRNGPWTVIQCDVCLCSRNKLCQC